MAESPGERARRLKAQRQRRWRLGKRLNAEFGPTSGGDASGPAGPVVPFVSPAEADGLPAHADNPAFRALRRITAWSLEEAERHTQFVAGLSSREALTPLRPGASPPASEARLQRMEARQALAALAATPVSYARVVKDATNSLDIAKEYQAYCEGRPNRLDGSIVSEDSQRIILAPQPDDDDGQGDDEAGDTERN
jgi:hypothetical protein